MKRIEFVFCGETFLIPDFWDEDTKIRFLGCGNCKYGYDRKKHPRHIEDCPKLDWVQYLVHK